LVRHFECIPYAILTLFLSSLVPQFDYLISTLTVFETLDFQAQLRLPLRVTPQERYDCIREVIRLVSLTRCADTQIGNDDNEKGISGGEKRRVSIAIQLLVNPMILLLDEPTTGLDSFNAQSIVKLLKALAELDEARTTLGNDKNNTTLSSQKSTRTSLREAISSFSTVLKRRTVIMSIHQPRYDSFQCFTEIVLLSRGNLIFAGPSVQLLDYFRDLGFQCPKYENPADFVLDITSVDVSAHPICFSSFFEFRFNVSFLSLLNTVENERKRSRK
jgi:ABC-type multidrug transport system ATPase subunit